MRSIVKWCLVLLIGATLLVAAFLLRHEPTDPFGAVREHIVDSEALFVRSLDGKYYIKRVVVSGLTRRQVNAILEKKIVDSGYVPFGTRFGDYKRAGSKELDVITLYDAKYRGDPAVICLLTRPIVESEEVIAKIKNFGRDPYTPEQEAGQQLFGDIVRPPPGQ
jgi:hypothetical protein